MPDSDLIDVEQLNFVDHQVWLHKTPDDSGDKVDIVDWCLSMDWPNYDHEYDSTERKLYEIMDTLLDEKVMAMPDKHKFDSRTYVKPKKRAVRPSIQQIVEDSPPASPLTSLSHANNKYLTYNKYSTPLGPILRHNTFNMDASTDSSGGVQEYAFKRRSLVHDDDPQLEDMDMTLMETSGRSSSDLVPSKPINIDLSQPAHNLHNTFNRGIPNMLLDRGSLNMYQSGESLMRMSPPSLVCSLVMDNSGTFNPESLDGRNKPHSGVPPSGRESLDPMMTSMTLSILDEKDMSTSFLSQTTYPDHDSLMDSLPPSLVSSVNSSYVVKPSTESTEPAKNVFSSATFTHLEQSERLLSARPRCSNLFNSLKSSVNSSIRNSESYTKSREEACQMDHAKVLNGDKGAKAESQNTKEEITLHYANDKFRRNADAEKENVSFEKDDAFYREMGMTRTVDLGRNSMNVTMDKQELNEIIQARQKLSLARRGMTVESACPLPNQVEPVKSQPVPRKSLENAPELLVRRRAFANGHSDTVDKPRSPPKRNATFRRPSPERESIDTTVVVVQPQGRDVIDINSATNNLVDYNERTTPQWCSQERAMVGSSSSTDTATFSSASPPDNTNARDCRPNALHHTHIASTPLTAAKKVCQSELLDLHSTVSPIYNTVDDKSYTLTKNNSNNSNTTHDIPTSRQNTTVINSATLVKRSAARRDILARTSPEKKLVKSPPGTTPAETASQVVMAPPAGVPRKSSLPTSKMRQYSSHRELRIPVATDHVPGAPLPGRAPAGRSMLRRAVYASNPALSPTAPPLRRDSYTIATDGPDEAHAQPAPVPALVRQGTETLRRERPHSQLMRPRDLRVSSAGGAGVTMRTQQRIPPPARPYSVAGASQLRVNRPASVPTTKMTTATPAPSDQRPASSSDAARASALPRPTRLPAPRGRLRPPSSVYSVAPSADMDHY